MKLISLFLLALPLLAGTIVPSVTEAVVPVQGTTTITFSTPVTVTLATNAGTSISSCAPCTSLTVTGPSTAPVVPVAAGCPVEPADDIWTTPITNLPVATNSANWITNTDNNGNTSPYKLGFLHSANIVDSTTPTSTFTFAYTTYLNSTPIPELPLPLIRREDGAYAGYNGSDHHWLSIDKNACAFYEVYGDHRPATDNGASSADMYSWSLPGGNSSLVGIYDAPNYYTGGSTIAAGYQVVKTLLTDSDFKSGVIRHPIGITLGLGQMIGTYHTDYPTCTAPVVAGTYWPAQGTSGPGGSCNGTSTATYVPGYGARMRLKSSFVITGYSASDQIIWQAMKDYGISFQDGGLTSQPLVSSDCQEDPACIGAVNDWTNTHTPFLGNYDFVDLSSLMIASRSNRVSPGNSYVTPAAYSVLTVTDAGGDPTVTIPVAVQPITIGMYHENYTVQAGTLQSGHQFSWWVNGTANQSVTWAVTSGVGTVTSTGLYTPPASVASITRTIVTGTSAVDSSAQIHVCLMVMPQGVSPANTIRINANATGNSTDNNGNVWYPDSLTTHNYGGYASDPYSFPSSQPLHTMYGTRVYASPADDDINGPYLLDAGHYAVTFYVGIGLANYGSISSATIPSGSTGSLQQNGGQRYWNANGIIQMIADPFLQTSYRSGQPNAITIPAIVGSDHVLTAIEHSTGYTSTQPIVGAIENGIQIQPDATAPYWAVDLEDHGQIQPNTTAQFEVTDWYTGQVCQSPMNAGNTTCTWSVLSGPGSINSSTGLYTAPTSLTSTARVKVQVTNGTHSAIGTFRVIGSQFPAALSH